MDAATPPVQEEPPARDWSLLPLDVLCSVFVMLGAVDVLTVMGAGFVCRSWLEAAKLPDVWRVVDMENHDALLGKDESVLCMMAKAAVDRSDGQLRVFAGMRFVSHELVKYTSGWGAPWGASSLVICFPIFGMHAVIITSNIYLDLMFAFNKWSMYHNNRSSIWPKHTK
jgi:hypothetical protein